MKRGKGCEYNADSLEQPVQALGTGTGCGNIGNCKRCGRCCKIIMFKIPEGDRADITRWIDAHQHMRVVGDYVVVQSKCKHLGFKGGRHYCKIWETRPDVCREGTCIR